MRVERLELPAFKNLREFSIDFDPLPRTTMLVGRNGTGKSNLIEALVLIFRDLVQHTRGPAVTTEFPYRLSYRIGNHSVVVDHDPRRERGQTALELDGAHAPLAALKPEDSADLLPQTLFAYYSGPSNRLEKAFDEPLTQFRDAMIEGDTHARQRLVYGRLIHSKFVLLSFFAEQDPETIAFLDEELGIEALDSVAFVIKQPYWGKKQRPEQKSEFWGARGVVKQEFLDRLYEDALAPLQLDQRIPVGIKRQQTTQHLYLFLKDQPALQKFVRRLGDLGGEGSARELFKVLESAYVSDLIEDVRVNVRKRNLKGHITFRELSEGEQQLLMVLGLLRFTKDEESLFLLDEPDTHLNPVWSLPYLELIRRAVGGSEGADDSRQLIIATHDPVAVALMRRNQVRQLVLEDDGLVRAYEPDEDPINLGVAGVLLSELFGFQSIMAPSIAEKIRDKHRLVAKGEKRTEQEEEALTNLRGEIGEIDLAAIHPDPLYARFVKRLLQREAEALFDKPVLSPEEAKHLEKLTAEVLEELFEEDEADA
jgi:predicted ATPase